MCATDDRLVGLCLDPDEFFLDSQESSLHSEVMQEIRTENSSHFVDPYKVKADRAWCFLADKVVGSELIPAD